MVLFYSFECLLLLSIITVNTAQSSYGQQDSVDTWSYDNKNEWGKEYPTCNGKRQSPINLCSEKRTYISKPLRFLNYDIPLTGPLIITNNGHSAQLEITKTQNGAKPSICGGKLKSRFEATQLHFHWGSKHSPGSEHTINNRRYDGTIHIVHQNVQYKTREEASNHTDGTLVLDIMIEKCGKRLKASKGVYDILDLLPQISQFNSRVEIKSNFSLSSVLGDLKTNEFYTYGGSLTTPPCTEAVIWIVFPDIIPIKASEIDKFVLLRDSQNNSLQNTYRSQQKLNGRKVELLEYLDSGHKSW